MSLHGEGSVDPGPGQRGQGPVHPPPGGGSAGEQYPEVGAVHGRLDSLHQGHHVRLVFDSSLGAVSLPHWAEQGGRMASTPRWHGSSAPGRPCPLCHQGRPPRSGVPIRVAFALTGSLLSQPSRDACPRQLHPEETRSSPPGTVGLSRFPEAAQGCQRHRLQVHFTAGKPGTQPLLVAAPCTWGCGPGCSPVGVRPGRAWAPLSPAPRPPQVTPGLTVAIPWEPGQGGQS